MSAKTDSTASEITTKPFYKRWWFWVIIVVVIVAIAGGGSGARNNASTKTNNSSNSSAAITLRDGSAGEYGEVVTVNQGTDFENTDTAFTVPAGKYTARNLSSSSGVQISFYSTEGFQDVDGHQERIAGNNRPVVLGKGESKTIDVAEGDLIVLSDGGAVELTKTN